MQVHHFIVGITLGLSMKKITGGEAVIKALSFLNVDTIFGIPGVHNLAIYAALSNSDIHHVTGRHEQEVGFMADGYARTSGYVGVALVISGPGLTNILTAMGEAFHEAIPLLVISTNNASRYLAGRSGKLHELTQSNTMVRSVAKESRRVPCTEAIIPFLIEAFYLAQSGRPAPVHVEIPLDLLQQDIAAPTDDALRSLAAMFAPSSKDADPQSLHHAATLLQKAKQPMILAGGGAWQAATNIRRLAEKLAAPVMLTPAAKGTLDDEHPLCLGVRHHFAAVRSYLQTADVLLAVGTELAEDLYGNSPAVNGTLIQIDRDASVFESRVCRGMGLLADTDMAIAGLLERVSDESGRSESLSQKVKDVKAAADIELTQLFTYPDLDMICRRLHEMQCALPSDVILACDSTRPAYVAFSEFAAHQPRSFVFPCGYGTLGMALPAAIGAKLAHPRRSVCVLAGDGGFQFSMAALGTACQQSLNIPVVIYNDHGFGEIREYEKAYHFNRLIAVDLKNPAFDSIAAAYGIPYYHIGDKDDLTQALIEALTLKCPALIEIVSVHSHI